MPNEAPNENVRSLLWANNRRDRAALPKERQTLSIMCVLARTKWWTVPAFAQHPPLSGGRARRDARATGTSTCAGRYAARAPGEEPCSPAFSSQPLANARRGGLGSTAFARGALARVSAEGAAKTMT